MSKRQQPIMNPSCTHTHTHSISVKCCLFLNRRQTNSSSQGIQRLWTGLAKDLRFVFASLSARTTKSTEHKIVCHFVCSHIFVARSNLNRRFLVCVVLNTYTHTFVCMYHSQCVYDACIDCSRNTHARKHIRLFITKSHRTQFSECSRK